MASFKLVSPFKPSGDQPAAIAELVSGIRAGAPHQVLLGVTGSGKTFTAANVIAQIQKPTLVLSPNKILAAQLYAEFKQFFPENAVEYFISYYDYYQPEAYVPSSDTYIEKDAAINDHIDRLRLKATSSLLERRDVIIVASVSCIYGLGSPGKLQVHVRRSGERENRSRARRCCKELVDIHYERNEMEFSRGKFRVKGDTLEIFPAYLETALRVQFWGDEIERISRDPSGHGQGPARQGTSLHLSGPAFREHAPRTGGGRPGHPRWNWRSRLESFKSRGKLLEAQRLEQRTRFDLEMMLEMGFCHGIENYSRHLTGRKPGERPACLIDYFPKDFLMIIDESHVSVPQIERDV